MDTEKALAGLAAELLANGDYDGAASAVEAAKRLNHARTSGSAGPQVAAAEPATGSTQGTIANPGQSFVTTSRSPRIRKGDYPKFVREGETLVKIGWSKSERAEYEHKSPKKVLDIVIPALTRAGTNGKRFAMEKVLPLKDADGADVPDYQAYLCLAWLRASGRIVQHGRQGYSIPKGSDLAAAVELEWGRLPAR